MFENICIFCLILGFEMGKWILRGTLSQSNEKFSDISRNLQSPAICLTALAYRALIPLKDWTAETVDEVGNHNYDAGTIISPKRSQNIYNNESLSQRYYDSNVVNSRWIFDDI